MAESPIGRLVVILHADVAGSTVLVQRDEHRAHERITDSFQRFSSTIEKYHGHVHEIRGDALVATFTRASDAVCASLCFQEENAEHNANFEDDLAPEVRIGISLGEVVIADGTLTGAGVVLAQRLEQLATSGGVIIQDAVYQTVPRRLPFQYDHLGELELKGFDEPTRACAVTLKAGQVVPLPEANTSEQSTPELPDRPSVAVLPFANMSGPSEEYFSDGVTEDIIAELSHFPTLFVIARHSSFALKGTKRNLDEVATLLGVKYIVQGSVRKAGQRVRVSVEMTIAANAQQIWAEHYDRSLEDVFAVQDEVAQMIVASVSGRIATSELRRLRRAPTSSMSAYENYLRGNQLFYQLTQEDNEQARKLFRRAVELDPDFARAHARLAATHNIDAFLEWGGDPSWDKAMESAHTALSLDPEDSWVRETLGFVHLRAGNYDQAEDQFERVLQLNPNDADSIAWAAHAFVYLGRASEAIDLIRRALRINPLHPDSYHTTLGHACYFAQEYEEAIRALNIGSWFGGWRHLYLAASYAQIEHLEDAKRELETFLNWRREELERREQPVPENDIELAMERVHRFRHSSDQQLLLNGLRKAGM